MKADFYTKAVLTVIAICLCALVLQKDLDLESSANAATVNQAAVQKVEIVGVSYSTKKTGKPLEVQIVGIEHGSRFSWESLPVKIEP